MGAKGEYDSAVKTRLPAPVAGFGVVLLALLASVTAQGQVNGTPPSVTSIGFGGHFDQPRGVTPSVTSPGPRGYTPDHPFCCFRSGILPTTTNPGRGDHHPPRHSPVLPVGGAVYAVPYPVYVVNPQDPDEDAGPAAEPENYPAGPTIFDRRASGQTSQAVEAEYALRHQVRPAVPSTQSDVSTEAAPATEQPETVLVFKDGHQLEVQNYAIVGSTLYDLTPGHRTKIVISDLDLPATAKENDDRGIDFQLPAAPNKN